MLMPKFIIQYVFGLKRPEVSEKDGDSKPVKLDQETIDTLLVREALKNKDFEPLKYIVGGNCDTCGQSFQVREMNSRFASFEWCLPVCDCDQDPQTKRQRISEKHRILNRTFLPKKYYDIEIGNLDCVNINPETKDSIESIKLFIQHRFYEDKGLFLYGDPGTGKTLMGSILFKHLAVNEGKKCRFFIMSDLIELLIKDQVHYARELKRYDVIFIDDIDKTGDSDETHHFIRTKQFYIFNLIDSENKTLITTANIKRPDDLKKVYDPTIYSRIYGSCESIPFFGKDYRPIERNKK